MFKRVGWQQIKIQSEWNYQKTLYMLYVNYCQENANLQWIKKNAIFVQFQLALNFFSILNA